MRKINCLLVFLLIIPLAWANTSDSTISPKNGIQLFEEYDFNDGTYTIVGLMHDYEDHKIQKQLGNFYIDNIEDLNEVKTSWVTDEPAPFYLCGYHYQIYVLKNTEIKESFSINLNDGCNTVVSREGSFYFNTIHLKKLITKISTPIYEQIRFSSFTEARNYYQALSKNEQLVIALVPEWEKYDGFFKFLINCKSEFPHIISDQECLKKVTSEIKTKFPNELFSLRETGSISSRDYRKIIVTAKGTKLFFNNFTLYTLESDWTEYDPVLSIYWRAN